MLKVETDRQGEGLVPKSLDGRPSVSRVRSSAYKVVHWCMVCLSLGTLDSYRSRLESIQINQVANLANYQGALEDFLTEWSGQLFRETTRNNS